MLDEVEETKLLPTSRKSESSRFYRRSDSRRSTPQRWARKGAVGVSENALEDARLVRSSSPTTQLNYHAIHYFKNNLRQPAIAIYDLRRCKSETRNFTFLRRQLHHPPDLRARPLLLAPPAHHFSPTLPSSPLLPFLFRALRHSEGPFSRHRLPAS